MSEYDLHISTTGAGVILYSDGIAYSADQGVGPARDLSDRDLAILTALVDLVSSRLHAEKLQRDMGIRDILADTEDPR